VQRFVRCGLLLEEGDVVAIEHPGIVDALDLLDFIPRVEREVRMFSRLGFRGVTPFGV